MVTQSTNDLVAHFNRIEKNIVALSKFYDYSYVLSNYVDRNFWLNEIKSDLSIKNVDNLTDFNYSKCFSYSINDDDVKFCVGKNKMEEFLFKNSMLHRIDILISVLAPYIFYRFNKYEYNNKSVIMRSSYKPITDYQKKMEPLIIEFCMKNKFLIISDEDLKKTVDGVSLDLAGNTPSVFNMFFEDSSSKFPYEEG